MGDMMFRTRMQTHHRLLCSAEVSETFFFLCIARAAQALALQPMDFLALEDLSVHHWAWKQMCLLGAP